MSLLFMCISPKSYFLKIKYFLIILVDFYVSLSLFALLPGSVSETLKSTKLSDLVKIISKISWKIFPTQLYAKFSANDLNLLAP